MKNEFTPKPGWLAADIARADQALGADAMMLPPDEQAETKGWHWVFVPWEQQPVCLRWDCDRGINGQPDWWGWKYGSEWRSPEGAARHGWRYLGQASPPDEINELRQQRDAARFEASRARGEAHAANLALKELRKKRNAECRALGRVLMIARDVLEPATKNEGNV